MSVAPLPFFLAHDLAETSSCCDELLSTLNSARIEYGKQSDEAISWLEKSLNNLNHGGGPGFKLGSAVVNRRFLKNAGIALVSGLGTVVTTLLALGKDSPDDLTTSMCCVPCNATFGSILD